MKKLFLLFTLASAITTKAQTDKGNWMVGGGLASVHGVFSVGSNSSSQYGFAISPDAGYFVRDNFAIGAGLNIAPSFGNSQYINCGISPFIRKYFGKRLTKPFANAAAGYSVYSTFGNAGEEDNGSFVTANIGGGLAHFITSNVALESTLHVLAVSNTELETLNILPSLSFGFQLHLKSLKREKKVATPFVEEEE